MAAPVGVITTHSCSDLGAGVNQRAPVLFEGLPSWLAVEGFTAAPGCLYSLCLPSASAPALSLRMDSDGGTPSCHRSHVFLRLLTPTPDVGHLVCLTGVVLTALLGATVKGTGHGYTAIAEGL